MRKTPGQLLQEARRRHRVSQASLAVRAGTTQSAISRIERGGVSPRVETLRMLLHLIGEDLVLDSQPRDFGIDRTQPVERLRMTPEQRLDYAQDVADFVIRHRGSSRVEASTEEPV